METEKKSVALNGETVIGTAKTKLDGKTVYLNILYGNRVILPDGTASQIDPAIYERVLEAFLEKHEPLPEQSAPTPEEEKEGAYFHTAEEFALPKREETAAPEEKETAPDLPAPAEETAQDVRKEPGPFWDARQVADEEECIPFEELTGGTRRRDRKLIAGLVAALAALALLLVLVKLGFL